MLCYSISHHAVSYRTISYPSIPYPTMLFFLSHEFRNISGDLPEQNIENVDSDTFYAFPFHRVASAGYDVTKPRFNTPREPVCPAKMAIIRPPGNSGISCPRSQLFTAHCRYEKI